jgi:hypothetical protein
MTCSLYLNTGIVSATNNSDYADVNPVFESGTGITPYHMQWFYSHRDAGVEAALSYEECEL